MTTLKQAMTKRTLRSAALEQEAQQKSRLSKASKPKKTTPSAETNNSTAAAPATTTIFGNFFKDWNGTRAFLACGSVVVIIALFLYFGLTPKAFLYSLGVVLALKTRI